MTMVHIGKLGIGNWTTEHGEALRLVVTVELRVGDLAGDLAARGFATTEHEPCPPGALNLSVTHEVIDRARRGSQRFVSGGAGLPPEYIDAVTDFDDGWDRERLERLAVVAERWHLNTMRAGCAHMTAVPVGASISWPTPGGWLPLFTVQSYAPARYAWTYEGVEVAHRDAPTHTCRECGTKKSLASYDRIYDAVDHYGANRGQECEHGYRYGSAWLVEVLPAEVIEYLATLGVDAST